MVDNTDFLPVQEICNLMAETAQQAAKTAQSAEETAIKSAQNMYETIIQPGSQIDKQLSAFSHATSIQLSEAWNSVKGMKERLETANFLSKKRESLMQQLRGNRAMLTRMREMSYAVNSKQMAALLRRITECYEALERTEVRARDAFLSATGKLTDNSLFGRQEPKRCAKYSSDPILGIRTCPLGFHLLILGATEISLRMLLKRRGFERRCLGPVTYYYHQGKDSAIIDKENTDFYGLPPREPMKKIPNVFVHGIGVGLIAYVPLIDALLETGRPLLLPEIPYVSGFRPWLSPNSVLSPAVVASTVSSIKVQGVCRSVRAAEFSQTSCSLSVDNPLDDSYVGLSRVLQGDVHWTLLWHILVELLLQVFSWSSGSSTFPRSCLLLLAQSTLDN